MFFADLNLHLCTYISILAYHLVANFDIDSSTLNRPLRYERMYLPLYKVADTPFHIQGFLI